MVRAIEGVYSDGNVELQEKPELARARVVVLFLDEDSSREAKDRDAAVTKFIAGMQHGFDLGGPPYPTREELNDPDSRR